MGAGQPRRRVHPPRRKRRRSLRTDVQQCGVSSDNGRRPKIAVIVSDLHCGSTVAVAPPEIELSEVVVKANPFQLWLWECWQHLWGEWVPSVTDGSAFVLVVNGDCIEGVHHHTKQVMHVDEGEHLKIAEAVLKPALEQATKTYLVKGTESHVKNLERVLGSTIRAEPDPATGEHAWDVLPLEIHDCLGHYRHHINTTSRPYLEGSQLSIHLGVERIEAARQGYRAPRYIARAHRHRHGVFSDGQGMSFVTGAWQGLTRYGHKVVPGAIPNPSCIILDWRGKEKGALPAVHEQVYKPKPPATIVA